MANRVMKQESI